MEDYDYLFKILLVGDEGSGKTSTLVRFVSDSFSEDTGSTVGVDFDVRTITHNSDAVRLQIWDTAGQERFHTIVSSYYRGAHAIIILFSVTDRESFEHLDAWLNNVNRYAGENVDILVFANKCDSSDRVVSQEEIEEYAKKANIKIVETSAKEGTNIEEAFLELVKEIHSRLSCLHFSGPVPLDVNLDGVSKPKKSCCAMM